MTFYYPDTSDWQGNISYAGCVAVCAKAGENLSTDPYFASSKTRAANAGAYLFAYYMIHAGNAAAQAQHCYSVVGTIPLMLDVEQIGSSNPGVSDTAAFLAEFTALGGRCHLLYLPHWYWQQIGSPSLAPLAPYGLFLVTSDYTGYSDTGVGWNGYGGLTVLVWQYTSTNSLNGVYPVDYNACKETLVDFEAYTKTGAASGTEPTLVEGDTGAAVILLQQRLNVWGANPKLATDGDFGPGTLSAVEAFQTKEKLTVDGIVGPATWAKLNANPPGTLVAYPAPSGLKPWSANLYVVWNGVKIPAPDPNAGNPVPSYTVQTLTANGAQVALQVVTDTNATIIGLSFGVAYTVRVWPNGGPVAPSASQFTITL